MQSKLKASTLVSLDEFLNKADQWNQLWESCEAYEATSRSETISLWVRTFEKPEDFRAVVVESTDGKFLGAIPLMLKSNRGIKKLTLTVNEWINCGELMISSEAESEQIIELIVSQLTREADVLEFDRIQLESTRWRSFATCLNRTGKTLEISRNQRVGMIDIGDDWDEYFKCLSGNHRSAVRRSEKKILKKGNIDLVRFWNPQDDVLTKWMKHAFEIENQGWKGANGSSILAAGLDGYFMQEAINARNCGMLELWFLLLDDQPIAFEYCHLVKGNCHSYKIGYDENFKAFGPGRQLRKMQLEYLTGQSDQDDIPNTFALDTMGLLCNTKAKWVTRAYQIGRLTASLSMRGRLAVRGKQILKRIKHRIRPTHDEQSEIKLGGASFLESVANVPGQRVVSTPTMPSALASELLPSQMKPSR